MRAERPYGSLGQPGIGCVQIFFHACQSTVHIEGVVKVLRGRFGFVAEAVDRFNDFGRIWRVGFVENIVEVQQGFVELRIF